MWERGGKEGGRLLENRAGSGSRSALVMIKDVFSSSDSFHPIGARHQADQCRKPKQDTCTSVHGQRNRDDDCSG